ncbi:MAG TPA: sensor histidine kinase [Verrucomicrobiae bacterium]|nr:sensor histidine kinase [Verrucomicrobiae bacterium]
MSMALTQKEITLGRMGSAVRVAALRTSDSVVRFPLGGGRIRRRFLAWALSFFGLTLTLVIIAGYSYTARQIRTDAAQMQNEIATVTAERINNFVKRKIERFSDTANAVNLYGLGSKEQQILISLLVKNDGSFTDASLLDASGMEVLKVSDRKVYFSSDLTDQSKSAKFIKAIQGEDYLSRVYTSAKAQPYITIATALWGTRQNIVGVATAEADLSFLWEVIEKIHFGKAGYGYLVDEQGNLIAHRDSSLISKKLNLRQVDKVREFLRSPNRPDPNPAKESRGMMDQPVLSTYAPVRGLGWAVILEEPRDAALANIDVLKRYSLMLLGVALFAGAAIMTWLSGRITGPIRKLHEGAKIIGSGNLDYRVSLSTGDEIEWLGDEFNKMAAELKVSYATLEQKVKDKTSELENANTELEQVNSNLVKANKAKDEFLSVMSHELRTPLNVVMGYTGMMKEGVLGAINTQQSRALEKVIGRSSDLLVMISQILQATSIEAGKIHVERREFDLVDFLDNLKSNYEFPLGKDITLLWEYPSDRLMLKSDPGKIKHILQNLVNNAIKFTEKGSVTVRTIYMPDSRTLRFEVADTGIGIQKDLLPAIFEIFHQVDSSETRSYGGVGLGLYIVKKYAELLNGTITAESEYGQGSTFTLTIPC